MCGTSGLASGDARPAPPPLRVVLPEGARRALDAAYGVLQEHLAGRNGWIAGDDFSLTDCSAAPALFYGRLLARPSVARVVDEARPYRELFPHPWPADMDALDPA
jgi:glutathione S-transferase